MGAARGCRPPASQAETTIGVRSEPHATAGRREGGACVPTGSLPLCWDLRLHRRLADKGADPTIRPSFQANRPNPGCNRMGATLTKRYDDA